MKHKWVTMQLRHTLQGVGRKGDIVRLCARCGMSRKEWEASGKPLCKEKLPMPQPDQSEQGYSYL